jgi:hypothetical protein
MSTTTLSTPVRIEALARTADSPQAMEWLREGISSAIAELDGSAFEAAFVAANDEEPDAVTAWAVVCGEIASEVALRMAPVLDEVISRHLPWTWPE